MDRNGPGATLYRFGVETIARLISPLAPHIAEEIWATLGHTELLAETPWPTFDPAFLQDDIVTLAVQVNGKLRDTITVPRDADENALTAMALQSTSVQRQLGGKPPRKVIVVRGKIVNIVAA
jgi:leucyl-tRNA synthetase